jgi:hypothetical protein
MFHLADVGRLAIMTHLEHQVEHQAEDGEDKEADVVVQIHHGLLKNCV